MKYVIAQVAAVIATKRRLKQPLRGLERSVEVTSLSPSAEPGRKRLSCSLSPFQLPGSTHSPFNLTIAEVRWTLQG